MTDEIVKYLIWPEPGNWHACPYGIGSGQQRRWRAELAGPLKNDVLDRLEREAGVTIVDRLPDTLKALVGASPGTWKRLCDHGQPVIPPTVTVSEPSLQRVIDPSLRRRWTVVTSVP